MSDNLKNTLYDSFKKHEDVKAEYSIDMEENCLIPKNESTSPRPNSADCLNQTESYYNEDMNDMKTEYATDIGTNQTSSELSFPFNSNNLLNEFQNNSNEYIKNEFDLWTEQPVEYNCNICNTNFSNSNYLNKHFKKIHTTKKSYNCRRCLKTFKRSVNFQNHLYSHDKKKNLSCKICRKKLSCTSALKLHLRKHDEEKFFVCDICGKFFTDKSILEHHRTLHSGDRVNKLVKTNTIISDKIKLKFIEELKKIKKTTNSRLNILFREEYDALLAQVKDASSTNGPKTPLQYRRIKRFGIIEVGNIEKLVTKHKEKTRQIHKDNCNNIIRYIVPAEEMFDILTDCHRNVGHRGRDRMKAEVSKKYSNITQKIISVYLSLCETCNLKRYKKPKDNSDKSIIQNEFNSRVQIDLIDMQSEPDNEHKFILVYQDHFTKFTILRASITDTILELSKHIIEIFCIFGVPFILYSIKGREFVNQLIQNLDAQWPGGLKLLNGKPSNSQSQESLEGVNAKIKAMLTDWMSDNKTRKWSRGLPIIQFIRNKTFHTDLKMSPYRALFGSEPKVSLATEKLPAECVEKILKEEDLESFTT